jgi:hypothetical protein
VRIPTIGLTGLDQNNLSSGYRRRPCRRLGKTSTGNLTTSCVGYYGQSASLYTLLAVFSIITLLCGIYLALALRTGLPYKGVFDPMDTTCLIAASAAAAAKGMLMVSADGRHEGDRKAFLSTRVMYEEGRGS